MELEPKQEERVRGVKLYPSGNVYAGELLYGKPDGEGTVKHVNGKTYQGAFKNCQMHGRGKHTGGE